MYLNLNVSLHLEILLTSSVMGCISVCMPNKFIYVEVQGPHCTFFPRLLSTFSFWAKATHKAQSSYPGLLWMANELQQPAHLYFPQSWVADAPRHTQLSLHWFKGSKFSFLHLESRKFNNWVLSLKNKIFKWFRNLLEGRYCKVMKYVCNSQLTTCGINLGFQEWEHG